MSTYGTMQDRIADEINRTDLASNIQLAIKSAIKFYSTHRFFFNEGKAVRDTADGDEFVGLPDDYLELDTLGITVNQRYYQLINKTHDWVDEINWGAGTWKGFPYIYAIYEQNIRLYPIPNDVYELKMTYLREFDELSASADTNPWMKTGEELIRTRSKVDLLENVIRGPDAEREAVRIRAREQENLKNLEYGSTKRRATNRIRPGSWPMSTWSSTRRR